jgi:hypothetical protein
MVETLVESTTIIKVIRKGPQITAASPSESEPILLT